MDETDETVFQPWNAEVGEYAVVVDHTYDACIVRDVLRAAATDRLRKATKGTRKSTKDVNVDEARILTKYAERCEQIRLMEAERISKKLGVRTVASQAEKGEA